MSKRDLTAPRSPRTRSVRTVALALLGAILASGDASGQVSLPPVQVPSLPPVESPIAVDETLASATRAADLKRLQELRLTRVRELLRKHRDVLEADPRGAVILRSEVLGVLDAEATVARPVRRRLPGE